ncbi:MAG: class I SAM-dependent methyltransferase [Myxococcales bacterium]|nr:class I SAM-dependent methyltransferase [Myxococcales bacterium]
MSDPVARACPACGLERSHFAFTAAGFVHVRCSRCATLFVAELPPPERVEATYLAPDYHSSAEGQELRMRAEADARAQALRKFGCRDVLEVGCGPGHFLDAVRELGMRVEGVDRARTAAGPRARGHTIHDCWLQDLAPVAARFDAVAMWEVIEHVPDPKDMLVHARKWLRPGGFLALSTPSSSGLPARALGARFPMVCPPDHLALFSRRGLTALLAGAGFDPVRWTSFSGLGREQLRRGFQRFLLGESLPGRALASGLAVAAELPMQLMDRAGLGSAFEVYAVAARD